MDPVGYWVRKNSLRIGGKKVVGILFLVSSSWHRSWFLNALKISSTGPKNRHPSTAGRSSESRPESFYFEVERWICLWSRCCWYFLIGMGLWALNSAKWEKPMDLGGFVGRICCVWKIWWQSFIDCLWLKITESGNIFDIRWSSTVTLPKTTNGGWKTSFLLVSNISMQNGQNGQTFFQRYVSPVPPSPGRCDGTCAWTCSLWLPPAVLGISLLCFLIGQEKYISLERGMIFVVDKNFASKHWKRKIWCLTVRWSWLNLDGLQRDFDAMIGMFFFQRQLHSGKLT